MESKCADHINVETLFIALQDTIDKISGEKNIILQGTDNSTVSSNEERTPTFKRSVSAPQRSYSAPETKYINLGESNEALIRMASLSKSNFKGDNF